MRDVNHNPNQLKAIVTYQIHASREFNVLIQQQVFDVDIVQEVILVMEDPVTLDSLVLIDLVSRKSKHIFFFCYFSIFLRDIKDQISYFFY